MNYSAIIAKLKHSHDYIKISSANDITLRQSLKLQISLEQSQCEIMATFLQLEKFNDLGKLLLMLDYMTYMPFGKGGIKYANYSAIYN